MLDKRTIFEIHRLDHQGWPHRKIARHLCLARISVKRYFENPERTFPKRHTRRFSLCSLSYLLTSDEKIENAIRLYNRMRKLFRGLSRIRQNRSTAVNFMDFLRIHHASFYIDPNVMVDILESVYEKLQAEPASAALTAPRILLIGPNLGYGDYKIPELIQEAGGEIAAEEICEGTRSYLNDIDYSGDLYQSLAKAYLEDRLPCAYMRNSPRPRLEFSLKLIEDFAVDGVVWYEIPCCETYDAESFYFHKQLTALDIPMLILEPDYGAGDEGQMKTRLEAFIEILKGGY